MRLAVASLAVLAALSSGALAAPPAERGRPCQADAEKFCKDVKPGGGAKVRCLAQHESEVSSACRESLRRAKAHREEAKRRSREFVEACKADARKLCNRVNPGEGRVVRCLADKKDQLSPACRDKLSQARKRAP